MKKLFVILAVHTSGASANEFDSINDVRCEAAFEDYENQRVEDFFAGFDLAFRALVEQVNVNASCTGYRERDGRYYVEQLCEKAPNFSIAALAKVAVQGTLLCKEPGEWRPDRLLSGK